ncbi:MAG: stalk domain-containing protein [Chloroherpetonaceae bacterium]|nr:stalk domain-containing protein [Chthonomonadaceae bacterium]MDW8208753.1 stalk domain-containing protein [Chloroherpetonaceae bacterium]
MRARISSYPSLLVKKLMVCSILMASSILSAWSQERTITLEVGSVIPVRLSGALSSKTARQGDVFRARVVRWAGETLLPSGTMIEGVVRGVRRRSAEESGALDLAFQRIYLPDGRTLSIQGLPAMLGRGRSDDVIHMRDGRIAARSVRRDDRSTFAGYGAGIGLIAGLVRKRPVEDALLGASAGYLLGAARGPRLETRELELQEGTALGVRLESRVEYAEQPPGARVAAESTQPAVESGQAIPQSKSAVSDVGVVIGDREVSFSSSARPLVMDGEVFVPVVPVLKHAGIRHRVDREQQAVTVLREEQSVRLSGGSRIVVVDGAHRIRMRHAAQWIGEWLYIPMTALEVVLGASVEWDAVTRTVMVDLSAED